MNHPWTACCGALLALSLAACGGHDDRSVLRHFSVVDATHITLHAPGAPDASLSSDGVLRIDEKAQVTTPAQQILLKDFYDSVIALRNDAVATGLAGAATARQAIRSVVSGLGSGKPDTIGPEIDAKAAKVEEQAGKVCADLVTLKSRQDGIAAEVAAFRPYAQIKADEDCGKS